MIKKLSIYNTYNTNPYKNLAMEKYLFDHVSEEEMILFLWQNERTVVVGRNQNLWRECNVTYLEENGGFPVRRLSGGGAVFHDLGNLNFTFICHENNMDVDKNLAVIQRACESFGLDAKKTGRNDLTIQEKKFSGNAFYKSNHRHYHHGTIMIAVDSSQLSKYLNVDAKKLAAKGVASVKSRVCNLTDFNSEITIESMRQALEKAYKEVFNASLENDSSSELSLHYIEDSFFEDAVMDESMRWLRSDEWLYRRKEGFASRINERFSWGDFDLNMNIVDGNIKEVALYSDALDETYIELLSKSLLGIRFDYFTIEQVIVRNSITEEQRLMSKDILSLLKENI